jgi:hypothetical protein
MANGLTPGPANDLGEPIVIDNGTLARTEAPPPGPIGLDARGGAARPPSLAERIVSFPRRNMARRVGDGECFTLADTALRNAGAHGAAHYGTVVPDADYVWGTSVNLSDVQPGDVVQFRNYRFDRTTETRNRDGSTTTVTEFQERLHHTAIVERVEGNGILTVLEQNSPDGSPVVRSRLYFTNGTVNTGDSETTVSVQGTFWLYRPQAR